MERFKAIYGYNDIMGLSIPDDPFGLLRKYSTKHILIKLAHINAIIYSMGENKYDDRILKEIFFDQFPIKQKIPSVEWCLRKGGSLFASPHLSELIKEALNNYSEDLNIDFKFHEFSFDLFFTILIYNDIYNQRPVPESTLTSFKDLFSLQAIQQYYIRSTNPITYLIKFGFICKFLSEDNQLRELTIRFCKDYGIASPWNISKFLINLYQATDKQIAKFGLEKSAIPNEFLKDWTLNHEYIKQKSKITLNFDIIPRPLFDVDEDSLIILDFNFFQYTVDQGFFYKIFSKTIAPLNIKLSRINEFKAYIGKNFFEEFLCKTILTKLFPSRQQIVYSDDEFQDFLVKTSSNNLLVIESKMTEVHAKTMEDMNFEYFKKQIEDNFLKKKGADKRNKGAYQILHQLKQISKNENEEKIKKILKIKNVKNLNIYPILITSDVNYNISGVNSYINDACFEDFELVKKEFQSIKPILVLNINTLLNYFGYFKRKNTNLTNLITSYFKTIGKHKNQYKTSKNIYSYLMASKSFESFVQEKLKDESLIENFDPFAENFKAELSDINFFGEHSLESTIN
ncbi:hypothetical protein D3C87_98850 [compost metagenome]